MKETQENPKIAGGGERGIFMLERSEGDHGKW